MYYLKEYTMNFLEKLFLLTLLIALPGLINAQACNTPPPGGENCSDAPLMSCNLDGYQGTSVGFMPGVAPPGFCGIIENNQWFKFEVDELPVIIQIIPSNCSNNEGLQAGFYKTNDCMTLNPESNCASFGNMNTLTVNSSAATVANPTLQIGDICYLMIDGFEGDLCDFEINVVNGILPDDLAVAQDATICPGTPIQLDANGSATGPNIFYTWTTMDGNIVSGADQISPTINQIGTYTLEVLDIVSCCIDEVTVEVTQNTDLPEINFDPVTPLDCTTLDTDINTNMDVPSNYTFSWDTGDGNIVSGTNGAGINVNQAGTYNVTVVNSNTGCSNIGFITVTQDDVVPMVTATADDDLDCITTQTNINANSLDNNLMYSWTGPNGFTSTDASPIINAGGSYTVVVTASNGCTADAQVSVNQSADQPDISTAVNDELDCLVPNVDLQGSSTDASVIYAWTGPNGFTSNQAVTPTNVAGIYTLTVTTPSGCSNTESIEVFQDIAMPDINLPQPNDLDCQNNTATLLGSSSTTGVSFNWTGPNGYTDVTAQPTINEAGTYTLTVIGTNGCEASLSVTVDQIGILPAVDAGSDETLTCTTTSVSIGGTNSETGATISYTWTDENGMNVGNDATALVSTPGTYTLTVNDSSNGCSSAEDVIVGQDIVDPIADAGTQVMLTCNSTSIVSNGTNSSSGNEFTYEWTDASGIVVGNDAVATFTTVGTYTLEVTNTTNGCYDISTVDVIQDSNVPTAFSEATNEITCINTATDLISMGSSTGANISYEWQDPSGLTISNDATVNVDQAGIYTLIVFDADNGCSSIMPVEVIENMTLPTVLIEPIQDLDCINDVVELNGAGSTSADGVSTLWMDAAGNIITNTAITNVQDAGEYILVVTDLVNGCSDQSSITVDDLSDEPAIDIAGLEMINCIKEEIELTIGNSATGPDIEYEWFDVDGNSLGTSSALNVNQGGDYTMVVSNQTNGCDASLTVSVEEDKENPVAVSGSPEELTCVIASVTLDGSQSTARGSIDFQWIDPNGNIIGTEEFANATSTGLHTLMVIDTDNGCQDTETVLVEENVSPPIFQVETPNVITCDDAVSILTFNTPDIDNSGSIWYDENGTQISTDAYLEVTSPGIYELEVVNTSSGCTELAQVEVLQDVLAPEIDPLVPEVINCILDEVSLGANISNNILDTEFTWMDETGTTLGTGSNWMATNSGDYTLVVENTANGCTSDEIITVLEDTAEPEAIIAFDGDVINCNVSSLNLNGDNSSGNSGLTYSWIDQIQNTIGTSSDLIVSNSGTYTLQVTQESNGCVGTAEMIINEDFEQPEIEIMSVGILTCEETSVAIEGSASGANENFEYEWTATNNGIVSGFNTTNPEINLPGVYNLLVTDQVNGCTNQLDVEVIQDVDLPIAVAEATAILDCITESVTLSGQGSSSGPEITYSWTGSDILEGATSAFPEVGAPGTYDLTVTNVSTGCKNFASVEVEENNERPTGALTSLSEPTCFGMPNGEINIMEVSGGTEPYLYAINDPNNYSPNPNIDNLPAGEYQLFIQDATGCEWDTSLFIIEPIEVSVNLGPDVTINLGDSVDLFASTTGQVNQADWTSDIGTVPNGFLTLEVLPIENTEYTVVVTNEHGCTSVDNIVVRVEAERNVYIPNVFSPNGDGTNDFFAIFSDEIVIKVYELNVYDKWGTKLFTNSDFDPNLETQGWDGTYKGEKMQPGVFVYHAVVEFLDGKIGYYKGDVTLMK